MTETNATTSAPAPVFPPGRYGRRREPRRPRRLGAAFAALLVVAATAALSVRLYQQYGDPAYEPQLLRYSEVSDSQIVVTFAVRKPADQAALCALRASARDGLVVGRAEVRVPAGVSQLTYRLATEARPTTPEVLRCRPVP
ncbi:MAG TPA: DUF4307 domain-containing protein [Pilimelia sp.]|nr:DUF4307 domain-containing protein [Pilimelia sp.]